MTNLPPSQIWITSQTEPTPSTNKVVNISAISHYKALSTQMRTSFLHETQTNQRSSQLGNKERQNSEHEWLVRESGRTRVSGVLLLEFLSQSLQHPHPSQTYIPLSKSSEWSIMYLNNKTSVQKMFNQENEFETSTLTVRQHLKLQSQKEV